MTEIVRFEIVLLVVLVLGAGSLGASTNNHAGLKMNFYNESCSAAETIVQQYVNELISKDSSMAASLLRLQFHDCFVQGCDASVLLDGPGKNTEKFSPINLSLRGLDFIEKVKSRLEQKCHGTVSCADIIALASRDAVVSIGGPPWEVLTGRRDGSVSILNETLTELPFTTDNITTLLTKFNKKGLNVNDLVVLSSAHTIGRSHCTSFTNRLYNFTGKNDEDHTLNPGYATKLKEECPHINSNNTVVMDPPAGNDNTTFDQSYYLNVLAGKGLFTSDAALLTQDDANKVFMQLRNGNHNNFYARFAASMEKMANIEVKTGSNGQIRNKCSLVNT